MNILSVFFDSFNKGILFYLKMFCLILQWRFTLLFITLNPLLFQIFHLVDWKGLLWYGYIKRAIRTQIFDWIKDRDRTGQKESKLKIPRRKECGYIQKYRTQFFLCTIPRKFRWGCERKSNATISFSLGFYWTQLQCNLWNQKLVVHLSFPFTQKHFFDVEHRGK